MSVCGLAGQNHRAFIIFCIILGQYMSVDAKWLWSNYDETDMLLAWSELVSDHLYLSIHPSVRPSVRPSVHPSVYPFVCLSSCPSTQHQHLASIHLPVYSSILLSIISLSGRLCTGGAPEVCAEQLFRSNSIILPGAPRGPRQSR